MKFLYLICAENVTEQVYGRDCGIEGRQLYELEDFAPSAAVGRFREMGVSKEAR